MSRARRPEPVESAEPGRGPERRRFMAMLLGVGAAGVIAAEPAAAQPADAVLDGGRP